MQQVKRQAEKDIGKPPQDRDTRDYPIGGRKPVTKPKKLDREPEPPPPPREGLPSGAASRSWRRRRTPRRR